MACGIAHLGPMKELAFAVVSLNCATARYSYAHEIGHNFGMLHDRGTADACSETTFMGRPTFNYGYRDPDASFCSILAYECVIGECDNMPKNDCPRVLRFSNTQFLFDGKAMGNQYNDNAMQWNNERAVIASFYPAMNCTMNNQCNDKDASTIDTCDVTKAVCVFTPMALTNAPIRAPTKQPIKAPAKSPAIPPTKRPTKATRAPTKRPRKPPTKRPTRAPAKLPGKSSMMMKHRTRVLSS